MGFPILRGSLSVSWRGRGCALGSASIGDIAPAVEKCSSEGICGCHLLETKHTKAGRWAHRLLKGTYDI